MTRSKTAILGIAVALVLPLFFYVLAKGLGKDKLEMPNYYAHGDTLKSTVAMAEIAAGKISPVQDFAATNQFGDQVQLNRDLPNKLLVVNVFFTTCKSTCPALTQNLRILEFAFRRTPMARNDTSVQFISITVDPETDTVAALRAFAKRYKADENHWWFVRADKKYSYDWIRNQLHLSTPGGDGGADDFIHSNTLVILDKDRYIRGYYDGLDTAAVGRCAYDLGLLAMEKKHK